MDHDDVIYAIADIILGATPDILESVLSVLIDNRNDFNGLSGEDVVDIVSSGVIAALSSAPKQYLQRNREEIRALIRRGLTTL